MWMKTVNKCASGAKVNSLELLIMQIHVNRKVAIAIWLVFLTWFVRDVDESEWDKLMKTYP